MAGDGVSPESPVPTPLLEAVGVSKRFGPVVANDAVDAAFHPGEIHALIGENGAGKSTLLAMLAGIHQPDQGEIRLAGAPVRLASPAAALAQGIGVVQQHFALVPTLSILDNLMLGVEGGFALDRAAARERTVQALAEVGLTLPPETELRHCALSERQRVEIAKALARGSQALLLDEPTSVLAPAEIARLLDLLRGLKRKGLAVILVTHKLDEVVAVADRITVLRQGRVAGGFAPDELKTMPPEVLRRSLVRLMFGEEAPAAVVRAGGKRGTPLLEVRGIWVRGDRGNDAVQEAGLTVHAGEIVALAGVDGNGQTELAEAIAGQRLVDGGLILAGRTEITNTGVGAAQAAGITALTADRMGEGVIPGASVADHIALKQLRVGRFRRGWRLDRRAIDEEARRLIAEYAIRTPGPRERLSRLSGGNIQRVLLARELAAAPSVLIAQQPTSGLDAQTTAAVLAALRAHADAGHGVLLISSDLEEMLSICDRVAVIYRGRIVAEFPRAKADLARIGAAMVGGEATR